MFSAIEPKISIIMIYRMVYQIQESMNLKSEKLKKAIKINISCINLEAEKLNQNHTPLVLRASAKVVSTDKDFVGYKFF